MSDTGIVLRSGGVGDFLLTLPLIRALRERHSRLVLVSRRSYLDLVREDRLADELIDLEGPVFGSLFTAPTPRLRNVFRGSAVYSLLPDGDGDLGRRLTKAGATQVTLLTSRPPHPPHVVEWMFHEAKLPMPAKGFRKPLLMAGDRSPADALWVHPGSGSQAKNAPVEWFCQTIREAGVPVILSFGEADLELEPLYRERLAEVPCEYVVMPNLFELRQLLAQRAARFVGNDTGITHLAAVLGIPTTAVFVHTDPAVWRPLGPEVDVVELASRDDGKSAGGS